MIRSTLGSAGASLSRKMGSRAFWEGAGKVIEFEPMRPVVGISAAILLVLSLFVATPALAQDGGNAGSSRLDERSVQEAMAHLTEGDRYTYDETTLEEPIWLLRIKEWFKNLRERWDRSPGSIVSELDPVDILLILSVVVVVIVLLILLPRIIEWGVRGSREGASGGAGGMEGLAGVWGEAEARRALELASGGMLREAVSVLLRTTLKGLDSVGWIRYRDSAGSRSYLRQLRRSADLYPLFRDFLGRFEVAYYRKETPDQDDWAFMYEKYRDLARVAVAVRSPSYILRG